jgi:ABC-type uncharacterized transport system substrate-binding protein
MGAKAMRRREFIALIAGAVWPLEARAQKPNKPAKIGLLYPGTAAVSTSRIAIVLEGLRVAGFREPEHVELVSRIADGNRAVLVPLAAELVQQQVEVVVAVTQAAVRAVSAANAALPIVAHDLETDPVASGLIESYARPGGKITGVFFDFPEFRAKWLELLQESVPGLSSVAILSDPATGDAQLKAVESAAGQLKIKVMILEVRVPPELENAVATAQRAGVNAILALSSPMWGTRPQLLADLVLRHKLPTVTLFPDFARAGGLMAYGPDILDTWRPLGLMVGKILQGTSPGDIPVERPSKLELVVNLKTARTLGITIPASILRRADEVIE